MTNQTLTLPNSVYSFSYDSTNQTLIVTLLDGTVQTIDLVMPPDLTSVVTTNTDNITKIQSGLSSLDSEFTSLTGTVTTNTNNITTIQTQLSTITSKLNSLETTVNSLLPQPTLTYNQMQTSITESTSETQIGSVSASNFATTPTFTSSNSNITIDSSGKVWVIANAPTGTQTFTLTAANSTQTLSLTESVVINAVVVTPTPTPTPTNSAITYTPSGFYVGNSSGSNPWQQIGTATVSGVTSGITWSITNASTNTSPLSIDSNGIVYVQSYKGIYPGAIPYGVFSGTITAVYGTNTETLDITETFEVPVNPTNTTGLTITGDSSAFTFSNSNQAFIYGLGATDSTGTLNNEKLNWGVYSQGQLLGVVYSGEIISLFDLPPGVFDFTAICHDPASGSVAVGNFSIPVYNVGSQSPTHTIPAFTTLSSGIKKLPVFSTNGLVQFNMVNNTSTTDTNQWYSFVQFFEQGAVPSGDTVVVNSAKGVLTTQTDVRNNWADGSIRSAQITFNDSVSGQNTNQYWITSQALPTTAPIPVAVNVSNTTLVVNYNIHDISGNTISSNSVDIIAEYKSATLEFWRSGPEVTEAYFDIPVVDSLYLSVSVIQYSNGLLEFDVEFNNDTAMQDSGGPIYWDGTITYNGTIYYSWTNLYQAQYQDWHILVTSVSKNARIQFNSPLLFKSKTIQPYNWDMGADYWPSLSGLFEPLSNNNVDVGMPGTGGRPDIGYETLAQTNWLMTGAPELYEYIQAQADAGGSAPWNYYDTNLKTYINTADFPNIWVDNRGGIGTPNDSSSGGLTQPTTQTPQVWSLDPAHMPDLNFIPYLANGSRWNYKRTMSQGCYAVVSQWPPERIVTTNFNNETQTWKDLVIYQNQVRGTAWCLRQVSNALWICRDVDTFYSTYFQSVLDSNQRYFNMNITYNLTLSTSPYYQGEIAGYLAMAHGTNNFAPWEQNYLVGITALMAWRGYPGWNTITEFLTGFTINSFQDHSTEAPFNPTAGLTGAVWNQRNGAAYELFVGNPAGTNNDTGVSPNPVTTWNALEYWTVVSGQSNGGEAIDSAGNVVSVIPNWNHSQGDYGQLCVAALVWAQILGYKNAASSYNWLINSGVPYIDPNNTTSSQFSLSVQ